MTWLFPCLALLVPNGAGGRSRKPDTETAIDPSSTLGGAPTRKKAPIRKKEVQSALQPVMQSKKVRLTVGIPVHNDAVKLAATLESIKKVLCRSTFLQSSHSIIVFCDGCDDGSHAVAHEFGAEVIGSRKNVGKWCALCALAEQSVHSEWLALVDAGSIWPAEISQMLEDLLRRDDLAGIAPSYRHDNPQWIERGYWQLERHLKTLENSSNGPVTVHGATVFYRVDALRSALAHLTGRHWLNDDVVIPLMLRTLLPDQALLYCPEITVSDCGERGSRPASRELYRRLRIVQGNVQWIRHLLPRLLRENPAAGLLALRRVFRLFWAYWLLCLGAGVVMLAAVQAPTAIGVETGVEIGAEALLIFFFVAFIGTYFIRALLRTDLMGRALDAAKASLISPFYILKEKETVAWR